MRSDDDQRSNDGAPGGRRIVVIGGGIGGAEVALTLAIGCPDDEVLLVGRWPCVRVMPDLVYMPFGVSQRRIDIPLDELRRFGLEWKQAEVGLVDRGRSVVVTDHGEIPYDELVVATGAQLREHDPHGMRSLDDAMRVQRELEAVCDAAENGAPRTIAFLIDGDGWSAPACELAFLTTHWVRARGLDRRINVIVATSDGAVFDWFGAEVERIVADRFEQLGVETLTQVPPGRLGSIDADLRIRFGGLQAVTVPGVPGRTANGWYRPDDSFAVAPHIYVVGDATHLPYRGAFAASWHARRVLTALGGTVESLGEMLDDVPVESVEYQMDMGDAVMCVRVPHGESIQRTFLGHDTSVRVDEGGWPDKLVGLTLHDRVIARHVTTVATPRAWRDELMNLEYAR